MIKIFSWEERVLWVRTQYNTDVNCQHWASYQCVLVYSGVYIANIGQEIVTSEDNMGLPV